MKNIILYTDGACSGNPGIGGWGIVLEYNGNFKELSGVEENTTNNKMELLAVINGLKALKEPCNVDVYSDSAYVVNAFLEDWITNWQNNGWQNANKKEVANQDLWREIIPFFDNFWYDFRKVKGHNGNYWNEECDTLAQNEAERLKKNWRGLKNYDT